MEKASLPYNHCSTLQITPDGTSIFMVLMSRKVVLVDIASGEAAEELLLDVDLDSVRFAKVSKSCSVLHLRDYEKSYIVHLEPMHC